MKIFLPSDSKLPRILYTVLLSLVLALLGLLITGTVYGLIRSKNAPVVTLGKSDGAETTAYTPSDDIRVFSGLRRLRIPLSNSSILILSIAFPYQAGDIAFTEELAAKTGEFIETAAEYFSSLPAAELTFIDEDAAKTEILRRFNANLRLGKIEALYFSDMMVIDSAL